MVCSRYCAWLKLGVTTVMRGRLLISQPPVGHGPAPAAVHADLVIGWRREGAAPPARRRLRPPAVPREDYFGFLQISLHPVRRLLLAVHAEAAQRQGDAVQVGVLVKLRPQLEIAGGLERRIDFPAGLLPQRPPPEGGLLLDERLVPFARPLKVLAAKEAVFGVAVDRLALGRQSALVPVQRQQRRDPLDLRELREHLADDSQRPRRVLVVGVEPRHHLAAGAGEALVDGVVLARILLADPPRQFLLARADDGGAVVGAAAVDDGVFEVRVALAQYRLHRFAEEAALVEAGRDDADARQLLRSAGHTVLSAGRA